jgi:protein-S-isoprenylcysteine O-methyltransferase Ste14
VADRFASHHVVRLGSQSTAVVHSACVDRDLRWLDTAERRGRRVAGAVALGGLLLALPGVVSSVRGSSSTSGRPNLVFTPVRLLVISAGWFGILALAWRPMPLRPELNARVLMFIGGLGAFVAGMALAVMGRLALGSSYRPSSTVGLSLAPGHRLVTTGPFAFVRHPMYVGLGVAAVGALLLFRTWACVLLVAQLPVLVVRARREERLLSRAFGDEWAQYADRVGAWLPGWR